MAKGPSQSLPAAVLKLAFQKGWPNINQAHVCQAIQKDYMADSIKSSKEVTETFNVNIPLLVKQDLKFWKSAVSYLIIFLSQYCISFPFHSPNPEMSCQLSSQSPSVLTIMKIQVLSMTFFNSLFGLRCRSSMNQLNCTCYNTDRTPQLTSSHCKKSTYFCCLLPIFNQLPIHEIIYPLDWLGTLLIAFWKFKYTVSSRSVLSRCLLILSED